MDWAASAIKPGRRSLNRTTMDGRRARDALKDPSHAKSDDVRCFVRYHASPCYSLGSKYKIGLSRRSACLAYTQATY